LAQIQPGRIIAIDIGDKWLGIAVSDPLRLIASPVTTIKCETEEEILNTIDAFIREYEAVLIVAGLPRSLDGSIGPQATRTQLVVDNIRNNLGIEVVYQDERYSTSRAKDIMTHKKRRTNLITQRDDAIAAAVILDDYLKTNTPLITDDASPPANGG
jgi:putative Holliday junction resolvase